jgi:hypothetical protein
MARTTCSFFAFTALMSLAACAEHSPAGTEAAAGPGAAPPPAIEAAPPKGESPSFVRLYNGRGGTGDSVCTVSFQGSPFHLMKKFDGSACRNDEAQAMRLENVPEKAVIQVYDDRDCGNHDDYAEIHVMQPAASITIGTFNESATHDDYEIASHGGNDIDGKVSCMVIDVP